MIMKLSMRKGFGFGLTSGIITTLGLIVGLNSTTISTFISKFIFALTFIIPILLFNLSTAIIVSIIWGLSLISVFSYYVAKRERIKPHKVILEHLAIAII